MNFYKVSELMRHIRFTDLNALEKSVKMNIRSPHEEDLFAPITSRGDLHYPLFIPLSLGSLNSQVNYV